MGATETSRLFNPSRASENGQPDQRDGSAMFGELVLKSSYCACRSINVLRVAWSWARSRMGASVPTAEVFVLRFPASSKTEKSWKIPYTMTAAMMTVPVHKSMLQKEDANRRRYSGSL